MGDTYPKILIVEDERIIAMELEMIARAEGYRVVGSVDTESDAVACFAESSPDIVLMDVSLRNSESGLDVADSLRKRGPYQLVFCTAHSDDALVSAMQAREPTAILFKPIPPHGLVSTLHAIAERLDRVDRDPDSQEELT